MIRSRQIAMALCLAPALATAAQPRERWSFAWDAHPQAAQVSYFVLQIDVQAQALASACRAIELLLNERKGV